MGVIRRTLSSKERRELVSILSPWAAIARAVLFIAIVAGISGVGRSLNRLTPSFLWWPFLSALTAWYLYRASRVLTGGKDLRNLIRQDIALDQIDDHTFEIPLAIVFPEVEDEGGVWCFPNGDKTWCVAGQWLQRIVKDGLPRTTLVVSMTPNAKRVMRLKASGPAAEVVHSRVAFFNCPLVRNYKLSHTLTELPVAWPELMLAVQKQSESTAS